MRVGLPDTHTCNIDACANTLTEDDTETEGQLKVEGELAGGKRAGLV